jgi:hypothetical protein
VKVNSARADAARFGGKGANSGNAGPEYYIPDE